MSAFSDTRFVRYVFGRRARALCSRGNECTHRELFSLGKLRSHMSLFSRELGQSSAPRGSGPAAAEAARRLRSWGSQMELADESAGGINISRSSAADESKLLEEDVLSLTSSDPAGSALLAHGGLMKAERIFLSLLSLSAPRCRAAGGYEACASAR